MPTRTGNMWRVWLLGRERDIGFEPTTFSLGSGGVSSAKGESASQLFATEGPDSSRADVSGRRRSHRKEDQGACYTGGTRSAPAQGPSTLGARRNRGTHVGPGSCTSPWRHHGYGLQALCPRGTARGAGTQHNSNCSQCSQPVSRAEASGVRLSGVIGRFS